MTTATASAYQFGPWTLKVHQNLLVSSDAESTLEHRHTCLLVYFLEHPNEILSKDHLIQTLWDKKVVNEDSLTVAISQLRKALNDNARAPEFIKTIPGIGYQFIYTKITPFEPEQDLPQQPTPKNDQNSPTTPIKRKAFSLLFFILAGVTSLCLAAVIIFSTLNPKQNSDPIAQINQHLQSEKEAEIKQAIQEFKALITKNPNQADAYLGVAEGKMKLLGQEATNENAYKEILGYLNKALELNPNLPRAHLWVAYLVAWRDMDYKTAEMHYQAALALSPKDELVLAHYAHFLMVQKRFEEAQLHIQEQRNVNPLNYSRVNLAWIYLVEKQFHLAEQELRRIAKTETTDRAYHEIAQNVYFHLGNEPAAYRELQWFYTPAEFSSEKIETLDKLFAEKGIKAVYAYLLETKETANLGQFTPPISWARYAFASEQKALGLTYLEQAIKARDPHTACIAVDPLYRMLLDEAHLTELLKKR